MNLEYLQQILVRTAHFFFQTFAHIKLVVSGNQHELSLLHVWCTVQYIVQKMEIYVIKQSASVYLSVMASLIRK